MSYKQKKDRRIDRTKRLIQTALTDLLKKKGIEEITVGDIADKADINRGTFYLHYHDKYDLLESTENEVLFEINRIGKSVTQAILHTSKLPESKANILILLDYVSKNSELMRALLGPSGNLSFQLKLKNLIKDIYLSGLKLNKVKVPPEYISAYISSAHLGVLLEWLDNGMKESPQQLAEIISKTTILGPTYVAGGEDNRG